MRDDYAERLADAIKAMATQDEAAIVTQWALVVEVATPGENGMEFEVKWNLDGTTPWSAEGILRQAIRGIRDDADSD